MEPENLTINFLVHKLFGVNYSDGPPLCYSSFCNDFNHFANKLTKIGNGLTFFNNTLTFK